MNRWSTDRGTLPPHDRSTLVRTFAVALALLVLWAIASQLVEAQSPSAVVDRMVAHEDEARVHREHFLYMATEKSDRTQGHTWTERVAETDLGRVRFLLEVDGQPLSPQGISTERGRLAGIVADPSSFIAAERAKKNDEDKARELLHLLHKAFVMENLRQQGTLTLIDFHPNPDYQTQSTEEKVLHGMSGTVVIETQAERLHTIRASLPQDVSVGFGLASIHAGSNFQTTRDEVAPGIWKTTRVDTNINGKAILFKSIAKNEHVERSGFKLVPMDLTVIQAVAMVEQ